MTGGGKAEALKEPTLDTLCDETEEGPARHSCSQQRLSASGPRALGDLCTKPVSPSSQDPWQCAHPSPAAASITGRGRRQGGLGLGEETGVSPSNTRPGFVVLTSTCGRN